MCSGSAGQAPPRGPSRAGKGVGHSGGHLDGQLNHSTRGSSRGEVGAVSSTLEHVVGEVERHVAEAGWDQPPLLFALVDTEELLRHEPQLAATLGLVATTPGGLTPVQQEPLGDAPLDDALAAIEWPDAVLGCALVHEVLVLPPGAEEEAPEGADLVEWAASHDRRREVRMAVGVLRDGSRACVLRVRADPWLGAGDAPSEADDVVSGPDLAPRLADALLATLA